MRKNAVVVGGKMLNQHDSHAGRFLEGMQQLSKRLESTGGGADSYNCWRLDPATVRYTQLTGSAAPGARHRREGLSLSTLIGGSLAR
jgi:hypothetical protein